MAVDQAWVKRNIGFDPIERPAPLSTFAHKPAAKSANVEDVRREIIDWDSEANEGKEFFAFSTATGLSRFTDIPWPKGLAPKTGPNPGSGEGPLPKADVLVVTWTVDERHALSRVLTPGKDSRNDYVPYTHNFDKLRPLFRPGSPALQANRLGAFWTATIGKRKVLVLKSDSHMSQDGPKLPNRLFWKQIIDEVQPSLVLTTGTAGGIGKDFEVGDVVVAPVVRFDCTSKFKGAPFAKSHYMSDPAQAKLFVKARGLFKANADQLPKDNTRAPQIFRVPPKALDRCVVTTDFFGFDTSDDHFKLQHLGDVSEMGDAVLGLVTSEMQKPPRWIAVRNVSDPQIDATGRTLREQAKVAAQIYKAFGRWSSVCSAIACWSLIAAEA
jgi:Phosphorylase superfamily